VEEKNSLNIHSQQGDLNIKEVSSTKRKRKSRRRCRKADTKKRIFTTFKKKSNDFEIEELGRSFHDEKRREKEMASSKGTLLEDRPVRRREEPKSMLRKKGVRSFAYSSR